VEFKPSDFECVEDDDIGELGCGAQSIVRLAKHQCLGWVAIKCFAVLGDRVSRKIFEETFVLSSVLQGYLFYLFFLFLFSEIALKCFDSTLDFK